MEYTALKNYQILIIFESTKNQVLQFNAADKNTWSSLRKYWKTEPITYDIAAECEREKVIIKNDDIIIAS